MKKLIFMLVMIIGLNVLAGTTEDRANEFVKNAVENAFIKAKLLDAPDLENKDAKDFAKNAIRGAVKEIMENEVVETESAAENFVKRSISDAITRTGFIKVIGYGIKPTITGKANN